MVFSPTLNLEMIHSVCDKIWKSFFEVYDTDSLAGRSPQHDCGLANLKKSLYLKRITYLVRTYSGKQMVINCSRNKVLLGKDRKSISDTDALLYIYIRIGSLPHL